MLAAVTWAKAPARSRADHGPAALRPVVGTVLSLVVVMIIPFGCDVNEESDGSGKVQSDDSDNDDGDTEEFSPCQFLLEEDCAEDDDPYAGK